MKIQEEKKIQETFQEEFQESIQALLISKKISNFDPKNFISPSLLMPLVFLFTSLNQKNYLLIHMCVFFKQIVNKRFLLFLIESIF